MTKLTKAQRARLDKLATYLEKLPADYSHFDMSDYCVRPDETRYARQNGGFIDCGTSACAVGHGPAAGILVPPRMVSELGVQWNEYSDLFTGDWTSREYVWCFDGCWHYSDDHHYGAAARVRHLLAVGLPADFPGRHYGKYVALYAPYRIDARDSGSDPSGLRRGAAQGAASQSGDGTAGASPKPSRPQTPTGDV